MRRRATTSAIVAIGVLVLGSCTPTAGNQAPTAVASASPPTGVAPLSVQFSSAGSSDPDGTITMYSWTFGDGGVSSDPNPTHVYSTVSTFTATLTVVDNAGAVATTSTNVVVTFGAGAQPGSGPAGTVISVTVPCVADPPNPAATAVAALATTGGSILATASFDNAGTGNPIATVSLTVPLGTPPGGYLVNASCNRYMTSTQYPSIPFTVT